MNLKTLKTSIAAAAILVTAGTAANAEDILVGLITKTDNNPFFVKMREGAEAKAAAPPGPDPGTARTQNAHRRRPGRKSKRSPAPALDLTDAAAQSRWQRIKGRFTARLPAMDPETLKRILTAAGVAAGVIIGILVAIKLTSPIALLLLGVLGLALVLRLWDRLL
jgi:hypothetical protein